MDCSPPNSSVHIVFQERITGVDYHFFLKGILLTQGSNSSLLHGRQILYQWRHQESPDKLKPHKRYPLVSALVPHIIYPSQLLKKKKSGGGTKHIAHLIDVHIQK